ncbi:DUF6943 family protein [Aeromonas veronii]
MKEGWKLIKLDELCVIERGGSPRPIDAFLTDDADGINWIKISDATASSKYIYKTEQKIKPEGIKSSRIVNEGDFILSNSMSFGRPYIMKTNGCIHDGWLVLRQPKVNPDYLYLVLSSDFVYQQFDRLASGSTVRNLNIGLVKSVEIPVPSELEQQRIVAILDEAFDAIAAARANAEQNRQNARALFDSMLNSVNGEPAALGDYVSIKTGKLDANAAVEGGEYPFFTCSKEIYAIDKFAFDCEAILLAGNNAVGDFNVKHYRGKFNAYQRTYVITVNNEAQLHYRFLYFQMLKSLKRFKEQSVGAGTKFLKLGMIKDLKISLPSPQEQKRLVSLLDSVLEETQRLESLYQRKITALDELKQSLLQQAFSGQL